MSEATGFAVVGSTGKIYVRSVSETRRAAIINWLVTERGMAIFAYHTDSDIEKMWNDCGQYVHCRPVVISDTSTHPPADRGAPSRAS